MKAKKAVAVLAGAALATGLVVGMTACKDDKSGKNLGTTTLNIADYAEDYETSAASLNSKAEVALTKVVTFDETEEIVETFTDKPLVVVNAHPGDGTPFYNVYNIEKNINFSTLARHYQFTSLGGASVIKFTYASVTNNGGIITDDISGYAYRTYDGFTLMNCSAEYTNVTATRSYYYVDGADSTSPVLVVTAHDMSGENEDIVKYFKIKTESPTRENSYVEVQASQLKRSNSEIGGDASGLLTKIYPSYYEDKPVEGEIANYYLKQVGNTYTFYNGTTQTGSVRFDTGRVLGCVEGNFYYYTLNPVVSTSTDGYNLVMYSDSVELKYDYSLYKYDILADKLTELNYNVAIMGMDHALYDYTEKSYNATLIAGSKMVNGVAYVGANEFTYVVDKDLNVAYDVTDLAEEIGSFYNIYNLGGDKFLIGNSVIDKDLNLVATGIRSVRMNEGLISFVSSNAIGFADMDGKVVIEPKYATMDGYTDSSVFYGGVTHVYEIQLDGTHEEVLLSKDGTVTKIADLEKSTDAKVEKHVQVFDNGFYIVATLTYENAEHDSWYDVPLSTTNELFTYSGKSLKKIVVSSGSQTAYNLVKAGNYNYLVETVTDTDGNESTTYYKIG